MAVGLDDALAVAAVGADVYFWQEFQVGDASDLGSFIMMFGAGYPTNAFALNLDPISLGPAEQISSERLVALAARTRAVIVSAFDDESYVIWLPART